MMDDQDLRDLRDLLDAFARIEAATQGTQTEVERAWGEAFMVLDRPGCGLRWPRMEDHLSPIPALAGKTATESILRCVGAARNELFCMLSPGGPVQGPRFEGERRAGLVLFVGDTVETPEGPARILRLNRGITVPLRDGSGSIRFTALYALGVRVRDGARVFNKDGAPVLFEGLHDADRVSFLLTAHLPPRRDAGPARDTP